MLINTEIKLEFLCNNCGQELKYDFEDYWLDGKKYRQIALNMCQCCLDDAILLKCETCDLT